MSSFPPAPELNRRSYSSNAIFQENLKSKAIRSTKNTEKLVIFPVVQTLKTDDDTFSLFTPKTLKENQMTDAEKMSKEKRKDHPRVSSYCIGDSINLDEISRFVTSAHSIFVKTWDECLYAVYEYHLKTILFDSKLNNDLDISKSLNFTDYERERSCSFGVDHGLVGDWNADIPKWVLRGEIFLFDYGVVVLWNFTEAEELKVLESLIPFCNRPIEKSDLPMEDMNYQYDLSSANPPRMFSDMITLKSSSPLIKLTISHALAQSVKLTFFENVMDETIERTYKLPRIMEKYGNIRMTRNDIMKLVGHLFGLKMDVNLISNVLDTPEIFYSEPELKDLYTAIREYMEISQRATVLNTRADIVSDLLEMLSDHLNSNEMTYITWIIILLIFFAVIIAIGEVYVKYLSASIGRNG